VLERLVALLGDRYLLVLLPTLLLMVATMFYILYWKVPEEEHP
jgi:ABC-type multidrug transport system permease subunit